MNPLAPSELGRLHLQNDWVNLFPQIIPGFPISSAGSRSFLHHPPPHAFPYISRIGHAVPFHTVNVLR